MGNSFKRPKNVFNHFKVWRRTAVSVKIVSILFNCHSESKKSKFDLLLLLNAEKCVFILLTSSICGDCLQTGEHLKFYSKK